MQKASSGQHCLLVEQCFWQRDWQKGADRSPLFSALSECTAREQLFYWQVPAERHRAVA